MIPVGQNPELVNPTILDYLDWSARGTTPALPIAGTLRFWVQNTNGISRLHYSDATGGDDIVVTRDSLFIARNTSGVDMTNGQAVYVSGTTGQIPIVSLAKSNSITTLPCAGVVMGTIANNGFGYVHMLGIHTGINTNAFTAGDKLYVSATVAGGLTNVKPNAPWQFVGIVISKSSNGVIYIRPNGPTEAHTLLDADEHADTVAHVPVAGDIIYANATPKWTADNTQVYYDGTDLGIGSGKRFRMLGQNRIRYLNSACRAYLSDTTTQAITSGVRTVVNLDGETFDTDNLHDNVTNNSRITFPIAGKWACYASAKFGTNANTGTYRIVGIRVNGGVIISENLLVMGTNAATVVPTATVWNFAANDYIEMEVFQDTGLNLNVIGEGGNASLDRMCLAAYYVGE